MPLTDYQAALARLLSTNRSCDSYLAGGAAILIEPHTARYSADLDPVDLAVNKVLALAALDSVEPFAASRPAGELGRLYYSPSRRAFVDPGDAADAVPHFGHPGGVLPRIADVGE